jgi:hypothetical protein
MSLQRLKARLKQLEATFSAREVGVITLVLTDGSTYEIPKSRLMAIGDAAYALAAEFDMNRVPLDAIVDPDLRAVATMESSTEDGGLLQIAQLALVGPAESDSFFESENQRSFQ